MLVSSTSLNASEDVTNVAPSFSVYASAPASIDANTGASFSGATVMSRVSALLSPSPSLATNVSVRVNADGSSLVFSYRTDRNAVS